MSNQNDDKWINGVGIIAVPKNGGDPYIKIEQDIVLKKGDRLHMKKKSDAIDSAVRSGKIAEDYGAELKEKLSWIKYELSKMPNKQK